MWNCQAVIEKWLNRLCSCFVAMSEYFGSSLGKDKHWLSPIVRHLTALTSIIFWSSSSKVLWVMSLSRKLWTRSNTLFLPHFAILPLLPLFRVILTIINISVSLSSARAGVSFKLIFKTDIYFEIYQTCDKRKTIKRMLIVTCDYVTVHSSWKYTFLLIFEEIILFFEVFTINS